MRWRHVREGRPTAADANRHDEVIVARPDGAKQSVQWHNLHEDVEWWAPFEELPDPPKPKYRPFVNAIEFHRYRDRWIATPGSKILRRVDHYNDLGVNGMAWESLFRNRTFEDGSPCGVEVSE